MSGLAADLPRSFGSCAACRLLGLFSNSDLRGRHMKRAEQVALRRPDQHAVRGQVMEGAVHAQVTGARAEGPPE